MITKKILFIRPFGKHDYEFDHEKDFSPLSQKKKIKIINIRLRNFSPIFSKKKKRGRCLKPEPLRKLLPFP